ncbi:YetF domain-containing protein [Alteribacillus bidgolensis]|uniref:Uncharacterized membrane protein YcaP, DUF421 family n=1 Tax=Alteribacillus bidgolensis TaxID=930129 RepID=A0A1G8MM83_9BACI|nr:DUF421 domain-containing protein [Alteribacillus bidgolensis]SDI69013.1 Uncharacterized membrane protein YcaP, DUF421 family [Alteribacillus bidgolensis]
MPVSDLILRLVIAFLTLLALTRIMGRKEISQMTFFNFASAIAIGTIGASLAIDSNLSIRNGMIALISWAVFTIILGLIDIRSKKARVVIEGQPRILIKNGEVMENEMRKVRLDIDALKALLREKNIFSIMNVDYAIFETDGKLSVMKKELKKPLIKNDMNIQPFKTNIYPIETAVISDGKIVSSNLEKLKIDKQWLEEQLQSYDIHSVSEVFYAELQKDGTLYIDKKDDILN